MAIKSIIKIIGNNIPAAVAGPILKDIIGIAKMDEGPANPPLDIPNNIMPIDAVR
tara:strand:+ start:345 stop:509 length:165 start_codon:yes stop_codon:yes gene_type:complete